MEVRRYERRDVVSQYREMTNRGEKRIRVSSSKGFPALSSLSACVLSATNSQPLCSSIAGRFQISFSHRRLPSFYPTEYQPRDLLARPSQTNGVEPEMNTHKPSDKCRQRTSLPAEHQNSFHPHFRISSTSLGELGKFRTTMSLLLILTLDLRSEGSRHRQRIRTTCDHITGNRGSSTLGLAFRNVGPHAMNLALGTLPAVGVVANVHGIGFTIPFPDTGDGLKDVGIMGGPDGGTRADVGQGRDGREGA